METIVITGAAGGIGEKTVLSLARHDRRLVCVDVNEVSLTRLRQKAEHLPGELAFVASALDTAESCREILKPYKGLVRSLAHLAGVFEHDRHGIDDLDVYHRAIASNLTNAYMMANAVFEARDESATMTQVYISSSAYRRGAPEHVPYGIAKAGLVGLTRSLGRRFAPHARINAIAPALIDTAMPADVIVKRGLESVSAEIPLGRIGRPEEVASVIAFLLGEQSSFINCQTINVDGGLMPS
jgi:NAD(P)-dependent dehydrogenase (short-subunit alcohol dehydrogenase family)